MEEKKYDVQPKTTLKLHFNTDAWTKSTLNAPARAEYKFTILAKRFSFLPALCTFPLHFFS